MNEGYDLRDSEKNVGQLLPVIKDGQGRIVDGLHRTEANSKWRVEVRKDIKTDEDYWKARAHLNFSRRNAHETRTEKAQIIGSLAKIYKEKGLSNSAIESATIQALNGAMSKQFIQEILNPRNKPHYDPDKISPIKALEQDQHTVRARYGDNFVERLKEEVVEEEKPKLERQIKKELLKSPEFQRQVISEIRKPRIVKVDSCPSGVCDMLSKVESGPPLDVRAESIAQFFQKNLHCQCKHCAEFQKCGVIY